MYDTLFTDYLKLERNYSPRTAESYGKDLVLFREFFAGIDSSLDYTTVDKDVVRMWVVSMMDAGCRPATVNRRLSTLRSFYRFMRMRGFMDSSPVANVKGPKSDKPLPQFVRESEMDRLLDDTDLGTGFEGLRNRAILASFYETGMRLAELIGLDDRDVDFGTKTLKVTGKRDKQRFIPFGQELADILQTYIDARRQLFGNVQDSPLFVSVKGERIPRHQVYRMVKENLAKVSTVKKKSPHVLRHSFATSMLNNNAELGSVRQLLGHESIATTDIYVHATFDELKKIYKQAHPRA